MYLSCWVQDLDLSVDLSAASAAAAEQQWIASSSVSWCISTRDSLVSHSFKLEVENYLWLKSSIGIKLHHRKSTWCFEKNSWVFFFFYIMTCMMMDGARFCFEINKNYHGFLIFIFYINCFNWLGLSSVLVGKFRYTNIFERSRHLWCQISSAWLYRDWSILSAAEIYCFCFDMICDQINELLGSECNFMFKRD